MKLDRFPEIEVSVRCDGAALSEYEDEADPPQDDVVGVRYIEATSGSNFSVFFRADEFEYGKWPTLCCTVKLDGVAVYNPLFDLSTTRHCSHDLLGAYGFEDGCAVLKRFTFADLPTSEF